MGRKKFLCCQAPSIQWDCTIKESPFRLHRVSQVIFHMSALKQESQRRTNHYSFCFGIIMKFLCILQLSPILLSSALWELPDIQREVILLPHLSCGALYDYQWKRPDSLLIAKSFSKSKNVCFPFLPLASKSETELSSGKKTKLNFLWITNEYLFKTQVYIKFVLFSFDKSFPHKHFPHWYLSHKHWIWI